MATATNETLAAAGTVLTASGAAGNSIALTNQGASLVAYLNVSAASGTSPSMTIKFQDSPDGTNWYDVPSEAFSAVTATGLTRLTLPASTLLGPNLRAFATISGTTPSFTFSLLVSLID